MLAPRADEISWKRIALVDISADSADKALFGCLVSLWSARLLLDILLVESVCD